VSRIWNSLRWRIVAYYTTLLAVAIGLLLALGHHSEKRHLTQLHAARMQAAAVGMLPLLFPPGSGRGHRPPRMDNTEILQQLEETRTAGIFLLVIGSDGSQTFTSTNFPHDFKPLLQTPPDMQVHAIERAGYLSTELRTRRGDRLILGMPLRNIHEEARESLWIQLAIGAGVLSALGALGALLVFGGLKPIARIGGDARKIAEGDLSARLDPATQSEELRGLSEVLNHTFDRLRDALQRQIRFTADASHELRTPLAAILADCEFSLHKPRCTERYLETIEVCQESARHMAKLVERLGLLARLDSDETTLEIDTLDLADAARRAISWVGPLARDHAITLHADLREIHAAADPLRIGQVLLNLLRNAIVYNKSGGSVTIRNGMDGGLAWFEVEDTGHGIAEEKLDRVFERFFRADESRSAHTGGAGLGLAICKSIMEAHGGVISVRSEVDGGTTFRIEWPAAKNDRITPSDSCTVQIGPDKETHS
jgi:two-component system, OmpR family, sensor kinase